MNFQHHCSRGHSNTDLEQIFLICAENHLLFILFCGNCDAFVFPGFFLNRIAFQLHRRVSLISYISINTMWSQFIAFFQCNAFFLNKCIHYKSYWPQTVEWYNHCQLFIYLQAELTVFQCTGVLLFFSLI